MVFRYAVSFLRLLGILGIAAGSFSVLCVISAYLLGIQGSPLWLRLHVWPYEAQILLGAPLCTVVGCALLLLPAQKIYSKGKAVKFIGEDSAAGDAMRSFRSRTWLQFYVDFFMTGCPNAYSGISVVVASDPKRRNGCNWYVSARATKGESKDVLSCLRRLDDDLRVMFALYDLETV